MTVAPADAACIASDQIVCLLDNRFSVSVDWVDPADATVRSAHMVPLVNELILDDLHGYAWFLQEPEVELFFRMIDGTEVNGFFWVFASSLTDLEYTLRIVDTSTGAVQEYHNPAGELGVITDVNAFVDSPPLSAAAFSGSSSTVESIRPRVGRTSSSSALLFEGRFRVSLDWADPRTGSSGLGRPIALSDRSAYFWLFSPTNADVMVKIVDGRALDGFFWFYLGSLTDVEMVTIVTDLVTGVERTYNQQAFQTAAFVDRRSFPNVLGMIFTDGFESGDVSRWAPMAP